MFFGDNFLVEISGVTEEPTFYEGIVETKSYDSAYTDTNVSMPNLLQIIEKEKKIKNTK